MTAHLSGKNEFGIGALNGVSFSGEGSQTANAALLKATLALDRMERHEAECGRRWGIVMKLMFLMLTQLVGVSTFLIADKLGWLS
jgi:hypothetical protein